MLSTFSPRRGIRAEEGRMRGRAGTVPRMQCGGERGLESSDVFLAGENERGFEALILSPCVVEGPPI
jgi:hypothetical protein